MSYLNSKLPFAGAVPAKGLVGAATQLKVASVVPQVADLVTAAVVAVICGNITTFTSSLVAHCGTPIGSNAGLIPGVPAGIVPHATAVTYLAATL